MSRLQRYFGQMLLLRGKLRRRGSRLQGRFEPLRERFYRTMWTQSASSLGAEIDDLGRELYRIRLGDAWTFVRRSEVMVDSRLILEIAGDKPVCHRLLGELGAPVPDYVEFDLGSVGDARRWLASRGAPAVVKPAAAGSAGDGVTTGVSTASELRRAAWRAAAEGTRLMAERQIDGDSYRVTYVGGEFVDAIRRNRPRVVGDGKSTIERLIATENERRLSGPPTSMHPLEIDLELRGHLRARGRDLSDVPHAGEVVTVKHVVNQNCADDNDSVREIVHPSIVRLGTVVAQKLHLEVVGLDVLTTDITRPLEETGGVVGEINTTPALHHHYLISDRSKVVPIADRILVHVLERLGCAVVPVRRVEQG